MASPPRDCPCHSGVRYGLCCKPFHVGEARAPHPAALMRSRYAAFSLGLGDYLFDTLAATHPERFRPRDVLVGELSAVHRVQRFTGLHILASATGGPGGDEPERGEVLFHARVFAKGRGGSFDRSFVELSDFVREDGGWRYVDGVLLQAKLFEDAELASLTRETFLARVRSDGWTNSTSV